MSINPDKNSKRSDNPYSHFDNKHREWDSNWQKKEREEKYKREANERHEKYMKETYGTKKSDNIYRGGNSEPQESATDQWIRFWVVAILIGYFVLRPIFLHFYYQYTH